MFAIAFHNHKFAFLNGGVRGNRTPVLTASVLVFYMLILVSFPADTTRRTLTGFSSIFLSQISRGKISEASGIMVFHLPMPEIRSETSVWLSSLKNGLVIDV